MEVIKVVFLGDSAVGKTSILMSFVKGRFDERVDATIASQFYVHEMAVDGTTVQLQFWDTAGQERFASLAKMYYRDAKIACVVYDVGNRASYDRCRYWLDELRPSQPPLIVIIANKVDSEEVVPRELGQQTANDENALFVETSAKTGLGIQHCFQSAVTTYLQTREAPAASASVKLDDRAAFVNGCLCG
ncbi:MAG: hypothetical protein KVP17_005096 [Porospora cf. gigantea B]|uniref:uncharacterized protein n=2 Tax=Porospora cf. gigantea B TaxID=2853592 RepID=UPI003571A332|nr:MAG: hypothetical protein KVP17_005096 [Porospora cf. gigantea B]